MQLADALTPLSGDTDPLPFDALVFCFPPEGALVGRVEKMGHPIHSSFHGPLLSKRGRVVIALHLVESDDWDSTRPALAPEGMWEHTLLVCDAVVGAESWQDGLSCEIVWRS